MSLIHRDEAAALGLDLAGLEVESGVHCRALVLEPLALFGLCSSTRASTSDGSHSSRRLGQSACRFNRCHAVVSDVTGLAAVRIMREASWIGARRLIFAGNADADRGVEAGTKSAQRRLGRPISADTAQKARRGDAQSA